MAAIRTRGASVAEEREGLDVRASCASIGILVAAACLLLPTAAAAGSADQMTPATIDLYNPTDWAGPVIVEAPYGRLAAEGGAFRLTGPEGELPYAVREGAAHWRATLRVPTQPRPEDLVVFSVTVPPGEWRTLRVQPGTPTERSYLTLTGARAVVEYPAVRAAFDLRTGALTRFEAGGVSALGLPLLIRLVPLADEGYTLTGAFVHGYRPGTVELSRAGEAVTPTARLVSSHSTDAMTQLHFVLSHPDGLELGLSYRLHANGPLEIECDERPWLGESPWTRWAAEHRLSMSGRATALPLLESRFPFYGFHDTYAVVRHTAKVHRSGASETIELGEEVLNGRSWRRRLWCVPRAGASTVEAAVEALNEGLVVRVRPAMRALESGTSLWVPSWARDVGGDVVQALADLGTAIELHDDTEPPGPPTISARVTRRPEDIGLRGDGFRFVLRGGQALIESGTRFGLRRALSEWAELLRQPGAKAAVPLLADSPVVDLRGGGFGGGNFEVDFPYGDEEAWHAALDDMVAGGMNTMACLGMWGNWKMPVTYRLMPELRGDGLSGYDEVAGCPLSEVDEHRERGKRLLRHLHDRGVKVWLWIPVGCVPTAFESAHPEAMWHDDAAGRSVPDFMHPAYRRYLDAFFTELLETYDVDGLVMIRDDNGGVCRSDQFLAYLASSRTGDPVWEQYLIIYDWLREHSFGGDIAVYPYNDLYRPRLDPLLPDDLIVVGHGSALGLLSRNYERVAPMGDVWLDNLYAEFRLPPTPRMRRLLGDVPSFWIGGAYTGTELPWQAVGAFGWAPSITPSTLRYEWAERALGSACATPFVAFADTHEELWDLYAQPMLPGRWVGLSQAEKDKVTDTVRRLVARLRDQLDGLRALAPPDRAVWLAHLDLFPDYMLYQLARLTVGDELAAIRTAHNDAIGAGGRMPEEAEQRSRDLYGDLRRRGHEFGERARNVGSPMLDAMVDGRMHEVWREWGIRPHYLDVFLPEALTHPQFAGTLQIEGPDDAGVVHITARNTGTYPWTPDDAPAVILSESAEKGGLPREYALGDDWVMPGEARIITFTSWPPGEPIEALLRLPSHLFDRVLSVGGGIEQ